jgi:hypothetical protein
LAYEASEVVDSLSSGDRLDRKASLKGKHIENNDDADDTETAGSNFAMMLARPTSWDLRMNPLGKPEPPEVGSKESRLVGSDATR